MTEREKTIKLIEDALARGIQNQKTRKLFEQIREELKAVGDDTSG